MLIDEVDSGEIGQFVGLGKVLGVSACPNPYRRRCRSTRYDLMLGGSPSRFPRPPALQRLDSLLGCVGEAARERYGARRGG